MAVIGALESVGAGTAFDEDTPLQTILACRPNVLVKGGDWPLDTIVGVSEVRGWGGTVCAIAFEHERSTTGLVTRVRQGGTAA